MVGVISATGGDFGPFRAVEESIISELTGKDERPLVLAWYVSLSMLGNAVGSEVSGRLVEFLHARDGTTLVDAYHTIFWAYVGVGVANILISLTLSPRCELKRDEVGAAEEVVDVDGLSTVEKAPASEREASTSRERVSTSSERASALGKTALTS